MSEAVLCIDNYDSFVFNLVRYLEESGVTTVVRRNDRITIAEVERLDPRAIVLSPGPCTPAEAGICIDLLKQLGDRIPILGVCLGHQAIAAASGGSISRAPEPVHGRTSLIHHSGTGLFAGCRQPLRIGRYHSLIVDRADLPDCLEVTASTDDGIIMALAHRERPLHGVQFHPESVLTEQGHRILENFLGLAGVPFQSATCGGDFPDADDGTDDFYRRSIDPAVFRPL